MRDVKQIWEDAYRRAEGLTASRFVRFRPWIGEHYRDSVFGCRILILGLSHYSSDRADDYDGLTIDVASAVASGQRRFRFFTTVAGVFLYRKPSTEENARFWSNVAFYNFTQELMPSTIDRTTPAMREAGVLALREVLDALDPHMVIVCGKRLHRWLVSLGILIPCEEFHAFKIEGDVAIGIHLNHPSRGFSRDKWHPVVRKAIELAGGHLPNELP